MDKLIKIAAIDDFPLFHDGICSVIKKLKNVDFEGFIEREQLIDDQLNGIVDILLFNTINPLVNEIPTLEHIKKLHAKIKIVAFLDINDEKYFKKLLEAGVDGFLIKSVEASELEYAINILFKKKSYYSHNLSTHIFEKMFIKSSANGNFKPFESINLTNREMEVLYLICQEYTNDEIADKLYISPRTVGGHRNSIMNKIGARNTAGLVKYALEHSLFREGSKLISEL
jgi:DNA-binding NarL/FixJ family response regulator